MNDRSKMQLWERVDEIKITLSIEELNNLVADSWILLKAVYLGGQLAFILGHLGTTR